MKEENPHERTHRPTMPQPAMKNFSRTEAHPGEQHPELPKENLAEERRLKASTHLGVQSSVRKRLIPKM